MNVNDEIKKAESTAKAVAKIMTDYPPPISWIIAAAVLKSQYPDQCILPEEENE